MGQSTAQFTDSPLCLPIIRRLLGCVAVSGLPFLAPAQWCLGNFLSLLTDYRARILPRCCILFQGEVPFVQSQRNMVAGGSPLNQHCWGGMALKVGQSREVSVDVCASPVPPHRELGLGTLPIGHPVPSN